MSTLDNLENTENEEGKINITHSCAPRDDNG